MRGFLSRGVSLSCIKIMITVKTYDSPPIDRGEILRYMDCKEDDLQVSLLIDECLKEASNQLVYKVCYDTFDISFKDDVCTKTIENSISSSIGDMYFLDLGFMKTSSKDLAKNLSGCHSILVFAATIGLGIDRLITKYSKISPVKALCFQAIGAERIESLCNVFNKDAAKDCAKDGLYFRPRFSPGYGDFKLDAQKEIFKVLNCPIKIGLSLNESLLMSPSKSVTALMGIANFPRECKNISCDACNKTDCNFRRI